MKIARCQFLAFKNKTTRERLIDARLGQGRFRVGVASRWNGRCAVTGCAIPAVIRASHIKPWSECTDRERLNPANGIFLPRISMPFLTEDSSHLRAMVPCFCRHKLIQPNGDCSGYQDHYAANLIRGKRSFYSTTVVVIDFRTASDYCCPMLVGNG
jgi:hypothetical protein